MKGHQRLQVYQKSYRLVIEIYRMTGGYPQEELYGITSQMRRAAASIPLNIAEGYAKRESQSEFKRFLNMALGSNAELSVLLDLSRDLGYIGESEYEQISEQYEEVGKMTYVLIQRVGSKSNI